MRRLGILLCCAACGDDVPVQRDAGDRRDAQDIDAPVDAPVPDAEIDAPMFASWGTPVEVVVAMPIRNPSLTEDRLELYCTLDGTNIDIYVMKRAQVTDAWGTPTVVAELSSPQNDLTPEVSADGLTIYFASRRTPTLGEEDIWMSTRASRTSAWGTPTRVVELSSDKNDGSPALSIDGLTVAMSSARTTNYAQIYVATRASTSAAWGAPVLQSALSTTVGDFAPMLSPDKKTLYYDSAGYNLGDLLVATRTSTTTQFESPQTITELNGFTTTERELWIAPNGRYITFVSNRGNMGYKLWEATR